MVGAGEAFFVAYALHLGFSQLESGMLVTVPIVIGGILQIIAPYGIDKLGSYKTWTVVGVFFQSIIFLLFVFFETELASSFNLFLFFVSLYWALSLGITPSWNSWISALLPSESIRPFFSVRNIVLSVGTLMGLLFSGLMLQFAPDQIVGISKFSLIFLLCFIFRNISLLSLVKQKNVEFVKLKPKQTKEHDQSKSKFIFRFILFSSLIKIGVYFSASFFAPYMLKQLEFNYMQFTAILAISFMGRAIVGKVIKKHIKNFDMNLIYLISAIGISIIPFLWSTMGSFWGIFALELVTGFMWGTFEIAFFVTCFEEIPTEEQSRTISKYNFMHTLCIAIGSFSGLYMFSQMDQTITSYHEIFLYSSLLRFAAVFFFPRKKLMDAHSQPSIFIRLVAVRPNMGSVGKPMWQFYKKISKKDEDEK